MNNQEISDWLAIKTGNLFVAKEYYHHHAYEILNTHSEIHNIFKSSLTSEILLETRVKLPNSKKLKGIEAGNLNKEIRQLLKNSPINALKFEVNEERGVFYFSAKNNAIGGFDFAILNHSKNLAALRNLCFGELHYHEGENKWESFLEKNEELLDIANQLKQIKSLGADIEYIEEKETDNYIPLIVGEIQFGNWGLAYRDFFKVLKANVQNSIDCLIYIVPTGNLESMLSDSIVTFNTTKKILKEFAKVISVPVWVVGLDIE